VLFIGFSGIDYDSADAQLHLDLFIRQLQSAAARYEGALLQLIIGDKGSYVYVNFGALSAHEDDARRAVKTALELILLSDLQLQMGIAHGVMRVGAYGGATRRTYGALGDEVNLSTRLMQTAAPGEILVSGRVQSKVATAFDFGLERLLPVKGKKEPIPAFAVVGVLQRRGLRLQEPAYYLPMVGRQIALQTMSEKLDLTLQSKGQVIGIMAEAGMGKSRLTAEAIRLARRKGFVGYGGACQSDGVNTPYLLWKEIWSAFFDVDPAAPLAEQRRALTATVQTLAPVRVPAIPLLGILLNLEIPDNDFTQTLEPKYRQSALRALLEDCLRAAAHEAPLLIVIEDLHWIDALSHDLLEELAHGLTGCPICFVMVYRPPQLARIAAPRLESLPHFTKIELRELDTAEAAQFVQAKLAQPFPERSEHNAALPPALTEKLLARTQGNPFYLEELLNFLHDRGLDPRAPDALENIELPDSLHTLILSRIDQLLEHEKTTLRVASIIGRLFRADWLTGYYPELGESSQVKTTLDQLAKLDLTPLDSAAQSPQGEPELIYLFKHIVTHEVTSESLPFATRAQLHEQLARYLETVGAPVDTLALHYGRSDNTAKQREYFQQAAQAAQTVSTYNTALEYLTRLLDLTPPDDPTRSALALQLADAYNGLGDYPAARAALGQAQTAATTAADRAAALALLGEITSETGDYVETQTILAQAVPLARASGNQLTLCRTLYALGDVNWRLGKLDDAKTALNESLTLARALGDLPRELFALNRLGVVGLQQDVAEAERLFTEVYARAVAAGHRERAMRALNNLGVVADERGDRAAGQVYTQQALTLAREIGAQQSIALYLLNLAEADIRLGQLAAAPEKLREGLALALRLGLPPSVVTAVLYFGFLAHAAGQTERALALLGLARHHPAWSGDDQRELDTALAEWGLDVAEVEAGMKMGEALDWDTTIQELLNV
jgi:tetratricopeptide (TPR) repeat protein